MVHTLEHNFQWVSARGGYKVLNRMKIPCVAEPVQLTVLRIMAGDITINPGPVTLDMLTAALSITKV